ncbi:MAG: HD domain-containing protein [Deferribacteres bacterium]|nr:HD domain-containing protein [Deferribacteres bacterium]
MTADDLTRLKEWFSTYTKSFYSSSEEDQKNILLKVEHTRNVCENIIRIADDVSPGANEKRLAETAALFHDVGRFPQYARYRTFRDAVSTNHGHLGAKVLAEENALAGLPAEERDLIILTVKFHNAFAIPDTVDERTAFFLKMVRDADKLDIFRVFIEYYESPEEDRASAVAYGLPDTPEYSPGILSCLLEGKIASYVNLKTENDFKLMKLSWIYGMNFDISLRMLRERGYIGKIAGKLPQTPEILSAMRHLEEYISGRLENGR